jgi:ankyrin repeat protein
MINRLATHAYHAFNRSALMLAVRENRAEIVAHLVEKDADITIRNRGGHSALSYAVGNDSWNLVSILVTKLKQVNAQVSENDLEKVLKPNGKRDNVGERDDVIKKIQGKYYEWETLCGSWRKGGDLLQLQEKKEEEETEHKDIPIEKLSGDVLCSPFHVKKLLK